MKRPLFLFAVLSFPISIFAEGGLPDRPYIYVEGTADIESPADIAELHFKVVVRGPDETKLNQDVQRKANKVFALLDSKKIATNDVVAETLKSEPQFEHWENPPSERGKLIGYSVTRPFHVKVHDILVFPTLVDELVAIGGVEFEFIQGALSKRKEIEDQAWEKALADARQHAEKTLNALGLKIDSIFAISPTAFTQIQSEIFGRSERVVVTGALPPIKPEEARHYSLAPVKLTQSVHVI